MVQANKQVSKLLSKQASKKIYFTVDPIWWGSLRLTSNIIFSKSIYTIIKQSLIIQIYILIEQSHFKFLFCNFSNSIPIHMSIVGETYEHCSIS